MTVSYTLTRPGQPPVGSLTRTIAVVTWTALPPPIVRQAGSDGWIDPLAVNALTVSIALTADMIAPFESLKFKWAGSSPGGSYTAEVSPLDTDMEIPLPLSVLAHNAGQAVHMTYRLVDGDNEDTADAVTAVHPIPDESSLLTRPTFTQASDTELDLPSFACDAQVVIPRYRLAADGQRYWLTLRGQRDDGSEKVVTIATATPVTGSDSSPIVLGSVARSDLEEFADGTQIELALKLTFNQSADENDAVRFRSMLLTIHNSDAICFPAPIVDGANASDVLDPSLVSAFRVRLPAGATFKPEDAASVWWMVSGPGGGSITLEIRAEPDATVDVPRDLRFLALGNRVLVFYSVRRRGELLKSGTRDITVTPHGTNGPPGILPTFSEESGVFGLDLSRFSGDAHPSLVPYYLLTGGQRYWMTLSGIRSNGLPVSFTIAENAILPDVDDSSNVAFKAVPRAYLEQFRLETYIHLVIKITLDKSQDPSNAVSFGRRIIIRRT